MGEAKMGSILKVYDKANSFMSSLEAHENNPQISLLKGELYDFVKLMQSCKSNGYLESRFCSSEEQALNNLFNKIDKQNIHDVISADEFDTMTYSTDTVL